MGGYDLISLSRHTPDLRWMAVDDHGKSIGSACFASDWYDYIEDKFMTFINVSVFANFNLISRYNQVFFAVSTKMTDLTFLPMLHIWTDVSILSYVKMLLYAKALIPDIYGQHLNNSDLHKY